MCEKRKCHWCCEVYDYYYDEDNGWEDYYCSEECEKNEHEHLDEVVEYERRDAKTLFNVDFEDDGWF